MLKRALVSATCAGGFVVMVSGLGVRALNAPEAGVTLTHKDADHRVDVSIDGRPFTAYLYPTSLQKPVLYPIRSAGGTLVTRGYPLEPRPGERTDHPHHVGHWFNHGDVNGYDFWGHSDETPAANKPKMGTIVHKAVVRATSGRERGELVVRADWMIPDGSALLHEETTFVFSGGPGRRTIDRVTVWTAGDKAVTFGDTKEGAFGIRVARALEQPSKEPEVFVNARGVKETVPRLDNTGVTGHYLGSDGKTGDDVWGTRGPWMALMGVVDGHPLTLAILDHPANPGYPTYWHARGYGLFAANPLGQHGYDPKQPVKPVTLESGKTMTFRHRILVLDGDRTADQMRKEQAAFAADR